MAKRKAKINSSSVSVAPPQPRSLRSRKREGPSDEMSETDDVHATHRHHQDTVENNTSVDATLLQCHHSPLQESTVKAFEEQEETTVTYPNNDSQLEGFTKYADNDANKSGKNKEETTAKECKMSPSQTCTDQLQVFLQISEQGDEAALEEQLCAKQNSEWNLKKKQEASQEEPSNVYMTDVKDIKKEATAGLPAKKKRRMGMCGLTEKERSHFLQTQKSETRQNGPERVDKQICNNTADPVDQEEIISSSPPLSSSLSIPVVSVTEDDEAEINIGSSHCGGEDRVETEVHIGATTSDGSSAVSDPGCSKGKSCQVEGGIVPGPEKTGDTKSDPPAEEDKEELLGNQEQQELEGGTAEIVAEKPQEPRKDREDGSEAVDQSPAITFHSNPTQNEETENCYAIEAALLQVNSVTWTGDERKEATSDAGDGHGAEAGDSCTGTRAGGFNAVELCEASVAPRGSERKDGCDSNDEPGAGPSTVNVEPPQTRDTTDPFGSGCLDYVSDSQLNTIILIEEEVMKEEEDVASPDHEDATDLICGLIRELSSLNRTVMATHRELENLRRSSKGSRRSKR